MFSKYLLKELIAPLLLSSIASLLLAYYCSWQGFFVNLGTTFFGILITFVYVDTIIQRHERKQWAEAKERIYLRIEQLGFITVTKCRISFGFGIDIFVKSPLGAERVIEEMRPEIVRIAENILIPAVASKIDKYNQTDWKNFVERMQSIWQSIDRSIELFGNKLDPKVLAILLDMQDRASSIITSYITWPDILGVPDNRLPVSKIISSVKHKQALYNIATKNVRDLLSLAVKLIQELRH
jgi:hypothetical protein